MKLFLSHSHDTTRKKMVLRTLVRVRTILFLMEQRKDAECPLGLTLSNADNFLTVGEMKITFVVIFKVNATMMIYLYNREELESEWGK